MIAPFVRSPYNYDMNEAGNESGLKCEDESLTKQSFLEESDINTIVRRFGLTGEMPTNPTLPSYGDYEGIIDFKTAMDTIVKAQDSFMELPAEVRKRFRNDPQEFLEFIADDNNRDEARRLKLIPQAALEQAASIQQAGEAPAKSVTT